MATPEEVKQLYNQLGITQTTDWKGNLYKDGKLAFRFDSCSCPTIQAVGRVPLAVARELYHHPLASKMWVGADGRAPNPEVTKPGSDQYLYLRHNGIDPGGRGLYIDVYMITSPEALAAFVDALKRYGLVDTPRLTRWKGKLANLLGLMLAESLYPPYPRRKLPPACLSLADATINRYGGLKAVAEDMLVTPDEYRLNGPRAGLKLLVEISGEGDNEQVTLQIVGHDVDKYPVVPKLRKLIEDTNMVPTTPEATGEKPASE